ncbi:MAG: sigma-70 family RNA polymerase sigma factor, partial [Myxococcota bacterium]
DFEGRASLRTWLYRICLRKTQHYRRSRARSARRHVPAASQDGVASPHDALERGEKLATALRILDRLDADKREVFVLYEIEQLPMREVAELVGCPLQTAYSRLYSARRVIKGELGKEASR